MAEAKVPGDRGLYAYQVNVTKVGDRLIVDNQGTDAQAGSINISFAACAGGALAAIMAQVVPDLAGAYGGPYRRVDFRLEPGRLNCADFPAAVSPSGAATMLGVPPSTLESKIRRLRIDKYRFR